MAHVLEVFIFRLRQKICMYVCVYCHMLKKIMVGDGRIFFFNLFFVTELMLNGI